MYPKPGCRILVRGKNINFNFQSPTALKQLFIILLVSASMATAAVAQPPANISAISSYYNLKPHTIVADAGEGPAPSAATVLQLPFVPADSIIITRHNFQHRYYFRFSVTNNGSVPDSVLFFPGMVITSALYEAGAQNDGLTPLPAVHKHYTQVTGQEILLPQILLQPGQTRSFIAEPRFRHFNYLDWRPTLVRHHSVLNMTYEYRVKPELSFMFTTLFFLGILTTMCVYAFIRFYTTRLREFLYYALSALCFILYFFYQLTLLFNYSESYNGLDLFLKQILQIGAHIFYMMFASAFLNIRKNLPVLNRVMNGVFGILAVYLAVVLFTAFSDRNYSFSMAVFNWVRILLLLYSLYAIPALLLCRVPLARYVGTGALLVSVFSAIAFYFSNVPAGFTPFFLSIGGPIIFFKLGILAEQVCFILGLTRKLQVEEVSRIKAVELLRIDNEKKEFEKYMAVLETREKERTRIAQEIHDDIGSGLTSIRLLSEIAKARGGQASMGEMEKISASANELIENMNEIIWSFNSKNDTLPNMIAYIRRYVVSFFEPTDIAVKISIPAEIPPLQISGDYRRSVFLVVKESLHNIMKHSRAARVELTVQLDQRLTLELRDDGRGFSEDEVKLFSNGLRNMRERMENIGGSFAINGKNGTVVRLSMPLHG